MLKFNKLLLSHYKSIQPAQVFQPVSLVLHGNQYLQSLSKKNDSGIAKKKLEDMKVIVKDNKDSKVFNAKDWIQELHLNGTGYLTLSKKESAKQQEKTGLDLMLVTSPDSDSSNIQQTFFYDSTQSTTTLDLSNHKSSSSTSTLMSSPMRWRNFALGDIRERIRNAVESMRDFSILNINKINLSEADKNKFLNALSEAEKFIQMDVMVTTKKENDRLFNFLQLPTEYTSSAQARVALQILNAAMSAWIFDYPVLSTSIISEQDQKINEEFLRLSRELYESVLDSVVCSTNYIE